MKRYVANIILFCCFYFSCENGGVMGGGTEDTGGGEEEICSGENCCPENFIQSELSTITELVCLPQQFNYINLTLSAGYAFNSVQDIEGNQIGDSDNFWVGAFNDNLCVGARQWILSECNSQVCDVQVYGSTSNNFLPSFIIYDTIENIYYDAIPATYIESEHSWEIDGYYIIEVLFANNISEILN